MAEELSPFALPLDELVTIEGAEAAVTVVGADTVVEPVFSLWLPALCCDDVTDGAVARCTAVGADTDVVWALDPLDWLHVQRLFWDVVVIAGTDTTERFVGAARLVLCAPRDPVLLECDVALGDVARTTPVGAEMAVDEVLPSAKAAPEKSMIPRAMPPAATTGRMSDRMGSLKSKTSSYQKGSIRASLTMNPREAWRGSMRREAPRSPPLAWRNQTPEDNAFRTTEGLAAEPVDKQQEERAEGEEDPSSRGRCKERAGH